MADEIDGQIDTDNDPDDQFEREDPFDDSWDPTYHHNPLVRELRRLKQLDDHQKRGYEFQEFIAVLFRRRHFKVTSNPGTAKPRQTDLLATLGDDAYVIEIKWRASKANIDDIDTLFTRLGAAPASVVGLMVSFEGFTESAIKRVEERSDKPVLLLTGDELERLVEWDGDLVRLLDRKKAALLTSRAVFFATASAHEIARQQRNLAASPAEFVFPDGRRVKWIVGEGSFGEFTFTQDLPDIDWGPGEGHGVVLDMPNPIYDERGILTLLEHLSNMGWATEDARWSIQQSSTNWHGIGMNPFAEALEGWRERYQGIATHHSEEFCYFDRCDGGFYSLTAKVSADESRMATYTMLSFQLTGIPLDIGPFKELSRVLDISYPYYFRPMDRRSVEKNLNIRAPHQVELEPIAFITGGDSVFGDEREWACGIVAKNPFYAPNSTLAQRQPTWLTPYIFESELLICDLRSWHLLDRPKIRYQLWGYESARTADATIVRLVAEWDR